ncbi:Phenylalanine--tRNA ligase, chloroplastic/mitochondrial [Vitis vinifera]|uniref:Phenylalanine--tRNA ligase, chloroplastic/mitochondrial n=1 Tax=Vitis vinifera TaxID=29760 RepID=A0A438FX95_VITVI|nr:Phenylalanine--tRNA ligase, chloroplastic/mitochondrial [Vitis vinifera]
MCASKSLSISHEALRSVNTAIRLLMLTFNGLKFMASMVITMLTLKLILFLIDSYPYFYEFLCQKVYFLQNFDDVLVPPDHVSRSYNDTYYIDSQTVLRCHTSAHQAELLRRGHTHFLVTGDVYPRDSIDSTHYPVFHQMEGVRVFFPGDWETSGMDGTSYAAEDLKKCLEGLVQHLFGNVEMRWIDTYFPFTNPSFELEIYFQKQAPFHFAVFTFCKEG